MDAISVEQLARETSKAVVTADSSRRSYDVVQEANEGDPPEDRWGIEGFRWDDERGQLVLQVWSS